MLIVEFVLATHCILTQWQVKPELPDSLQLLHRDTTFAIGIPIYAKLTIARHPLGWYAPTLRSDSIFLSFGLIVRPNYLMLSFFELVGRIYVVLGKIRRRDGCFGMTLYKIIFRSVYLNKIFRLVRPVWYHEASVDTTQSWRAGYGSRTGVASWLCMPLCPP